MGPWLIFQLINGASLSLFYGNPASKQFCKFIEHSKVSVLGVIPSLVKTWQQNNATLDCDWSGIKLFSSTGEASDPKAMLWLMSRAHFKPVIEYCGGTELAGSYLSSTVLHPNVPSMFSTPVLGSHFMVINQNQDFIDCSPDANGTGSGEVALVPPSLGLSTMLLNRDHHECYYVGMPAGPNGELLRRHGDEIEVVEWYHRNSRNFYVENSATTSVTSNENHRNRYQYHSKSHVQQYKGDEMTTKYKYFRALGRCDDTMNLGGIKVSSVEIEVVCNKFDKISETSAIAIHPVDGGPSQLVLFVVLMHNRSSVSGDEDDDSRGIITHHHCRHRYHHRHY